MFPYLILEAATVVYLHLALELPLIADLRKKKVANLQGRTCGLRWSAAVKTSLTWRILTLPLSDSSFGREHFRGYSAVEQHAVLAYVS